MDKIWNPCDIGELMIEPGSRELRDKCEAFALLAEKRRSSFKLLDSSAFADMAVSAMKEISTALEKTRAWKELSEDQQNLLLKKVKSTVLSVALKHWKSPVLLKKDEVFAEKVDEAIAKITPQHLSVNSNVLKNPFFYCAFREMKQLNDFQTPADIVQILKCCKNSLNSLPSFTYDCACVLHHCVSCLNRD